MSGDPGEPIAGAGGTGAARRSRPGSEPLSATAGAPDAAARRRADGRPAPLWGSFPLSELVILIGLILLVAGFFVTGQRGGVMMIVGLTLGGLGGLELAVREHFAGYKSHTTLLSGAVGVAVLVGLILATSVNPAVCAAVAIAALVGSLWLFANAFRRRSGGALFRIRAK